MNEPKAKRPEVDAKALHGTSNTEREWIHHGRVGAKECFLYMFLQFGLDGVRRV